VIEPLKSTLQAARVRGQWREIHGVGYCHQQVDVLRIGFVRHDRAEERDTLNTGKGPCRADKSMNASQHLVTNGALRRLRHDLRQRPENFFLLDGLETLVQGQSMVDGLPSIRVTKVRQMEAIAPSILHASRPHDEVLSGPTRRHSISHTQMERPSAPLREHGNRIVEFV
jgi:hypothetical protein